MQVEEWGVGLGRTVAKWKVSLGRTDAIAVVQSLSDV